MKVMKYFKIKIRRLNYLLKTREGGFPVLPYMESLEMVHDHNEIERIEIEFENENDSIDFLNKFPKYCNGKKCEIWQSDGSIKWSVHFSFNTFFINKKTGDKNEKAFLTREKVINRIKEII